MKQIKSYGKAVLTLNVLSKNIVHKEQFRDSRRGNQELNRRSKLFLKIQEYNLKSFKKFNDDVNFKRLMNLFPAFDPLTVTITKSN